MAFSKQSINIDPAAETERILQFMRQSVRQLLHRQGGVVGISGGVDSSVVLALCLRAFGGEKVTALILPEKDSDPESERLGCLVANHYGIEPLLENITPVLDGFGCYPRRDEAIRRIFPEYDADQGLYSENCPAAKYAGRRHAECVFPGHRHPGRGGKKPAPPAA